MLIGLLNCLVLLTTPSLSRTYGFIKFQQRHMLRGINIYGESGSVDVEAMNKALPGVNKVIAEYALCDVYNMDETGKFCLLYFQLKPSLTKFTLQDYTTA